MRRWIVRSLLVLALGAVVVWALLPSDPIPVRVVRVEKGVVESTITNSKAGTIRARRRARLSPETGGRVVEIVHQEGDRVEQGAVLIRLSDATQRAQLLLAEQSISAAESVRQEACVTRDRARRELRRKRKLADENIVSVDVIDGLESTYQVASAACKARAAEVEKARFSMALASAELDKLVIRAPFAGVIAELDADLGEWITPAPPLLTVPSVVDLIDPASFYVSAPMDEVDSARVREGQRTKVTIDSYPAQQFPGSVVRVAPYVLDVEAQNRTVEIEVELDDTEFSSTLLPGTSADVEVILEVHEDVLRVPTAVLVDQSRVLVANDGKLEERTVQVGLKNWDFAEITGGLGPEDRVVSTLDRAEIRAGARVVVEEAPARP